jgi:predicted Rossmann fold flavoprotein
MDKFNLVVVGGGAAGFYAAIHSAEMHPGLKVLILEKSNKLLSKVRVSGGGRCNVTHHCFNPIKLSHHYPRGEKFLRSIFKEYDAEKTVAWFEEKGVHLKVESDGRMFPTTDDSETIIDCFTREAARLNVKINLAAPVISLKPNGNIFVVETGCGTFHTEKVLIAIGGSPKAEAYQWLRDLGHKIHPPIPSLFTFNDSGKKFIDLMGISVPNAEVRIAGSKFAQSGALLITHWGFSGPAIIKLSSWAAEYLYALHYNFTALISWIGPCKEETIRTFLQSQKAARSKQKIYGNPLFDLPQRLWTRLCELSGIQEEKIWGEVAQKNLNKLLENLIRCPFDIRGKTTFKEEFVTCGGLDLNEVDVSTMESKIVKGIFFAGEVLNIDGETGGFNFQSAWTTAFIAARSLRHTPTL